MEPLTFLSSDESVIVIEDGCLLPVGVGTAFVTVQCLGMNDYSFSVSITDDECTYIRLPQSMVSIASEAFYGDSSITHVVLPDGLTALGSDAFDLCENLKTICIPSSVTSIEENSFSNAVIICSENSIAHEYVVTNALAYILLDDTYNDE